MKLNDVINSSIYYYPMLYKAKTYEESRILVLNHLFLSYGNGYEWHKDGYLFPWKYETKNRKTLPKNYFDIDLFCIAVPSNKIKELKEIKGYFYTGRKSPFDGNTDVFFVDNPDIDKKGWKNCVIVEKANCQHKYHPSDICHYSAICELTEGKTNSTHNKNFKLKPQQDWLDGAIEIAKRSLDYYSNDEECKFNYHCGGKPKITGGEIPGNLKDPSWLEYKKEQIDYLNKFLKKCS